MRVRLRCRPASGAWCLASVLALSGCASWDVHEARTPFGRHSLIGMAVPDLVQCMGTDYVFRPLKPDEGVLMWTRRDTSTTLKASVTLVGSLELGGGGGCSVAFDVSRRGTVYDVHFPQVFNDGLLAEPYHACKPLIAECEGYHGDTGLPAGYDAFAYLQATKP